MRGAFAFLAVCAALALPVAQAAASTVHDPLGPLPAEPGAGPAVCLGQIPPIDLDGHCEGNGVNLARCLTENGFELRSNIPGVPDRELPVGLCPLGPFT